MATKRRKKATKRNAIAEAAPISSFDEIEGAGAYLMNQTGHLLRLPENGLDQNHSPQLAIIGTEDMTVTKLSDNPFITRTKARSIAKDWGLKAKF